MVGGEEVGWWGEELGGNVVRASVGGRCVLEVGCEKGKRKLPVRELNPGHPRDRRVY